MARLSTVYVPIDELADGGQIVRCVTADPAASADLDETHNRAAK